MRCSIFVTAPFLAAAFAQHTTSTVSYSNPITSFLTQTNSDGLVTGLPTLSGNGPTGLVTSQPAVATIPAGLPKGETTLYYSASKTLESFAISVGPSTTLVLGGDQVGPSASVVSGSSAGVAAPSGGSNGGGNGSGSGSGSDGSDSSSDNAAPSVRAAAGMVVFGVFAALLL